MFMATQKIEKHTKNTVMLLEDFEGGGVLSHSNR